MKFKRVWLSIIMFILVSLLLPITGHADDNIVPKGTPSADPFSVGRLVFVGGFTQQPLSLNTVSDKDYQLSFTAIKSLFDPWTDNITASWYISEDGQNWKKAQDDGNALSGSFKTHQHVDHVSTFYYQISVSIHGFLTSSVYWSKVAKVTISPQDVHATALSIAGESDTLPNANSENILATLTPANATDSIKWSVDNSQLATIDATSGKLTATSDLNQYGKVTVTATTSNGITASTVVYVGALQDKLVNEGTDASFIIKGFPKSAYVVGWHQIPPHGSDKPATNGPNVSISASPDGMQNGMLTVKNTSASQTQTQYYAVIGFNGADQQTNTNKARLFVNPGGQLTLDAIPNFTFSKADGTPLTVNNITHGVSLASISNTPGSTSLTYDGNDQQLLSIYDPRVHSSGWSLTAAMAAFTNTATHQPIGDKGGISLNLINDQNKSLATLKDDDQPVSVINATTPNTNVHSLLSGSTLTIDPTHAANSGHYSATISWTLADVPTANAAK
ncbi:WxL domain-containing protein [Furfurilactobacillus milii]|uniref:BIG2 domain-containing protein n=1 Tax=Furfurilactobacillus milii TaxID=2888272 RepID=A0A6N9I2T9_9LACO|nr:WxL domain-containing protein [Furfurilactobacillus milii]MYV17107.1 hypothetical protein [Furfurilactobacillus milii]